MHSRLLKNLDAVIGSAQDGVLWARAMCRQASHFARQGETEEALRSIATVRSRFGHSLTPEVAVWLMLAEGIISFSTVDSTRFADRVKRAHGLALAANYDAGRAAAAAWLSLSCFNNRRYDEAIALLKEAFEVAAKDDHQARARASLTLAISFHLAGRFDLARPWYEATRQHALAEGDESTISAMLFNVATFRASNVKFASALGLEFKEEAHRANLEASSAAAFDQAIGTKSFPQLFPEFLAHLLVVEGKYQDALDQLQRMDLRELAAWGHAAYYADYATCANQLGKNDLASQSMYQALAALEAPIDHDDAAYACCRLAPVAEAIGDSALAAKLRTRAELEAVKYREFQGDLAAKLLAVSSIASRPQSTSEASD